MAKVCVKDLPGPSFCSCCCRLSSRWRKALPLRYASMLQSKGMLNELSLGGEFSSLHQNSFHHYRDFWCFDVTSHQWDRIDTKIRPSARSGCRYVSSSQFSVHHYMIASLEWQCGSITSSFLVASMTLESEVRWLNAICCILSLTTISNSELLERPMVL